MNEGAGEAARARWLDRWLDLDTDARQRALADPDLPESWRAAATRLLALSARQGILDRDPGDLAEQLIGKPFGQPERGALAGRYRLEALIGEGGMATVWRARHQDPELPKQVAVKCLRASLSTPEWCERFLREQRILARLSHPNVTRLYDAGISDSGTPYIVMELVDGRPITDHCDAHRLSCRQRVQLFLKVCAAVAYAHRNLVVHRDLKPSNVLIGQDGEPHLLDFGIAKLLDATGADEHLTRTGMAVLTPAYAAPEQLAQGTITTATDVYGLGAMLHELLTGTRTRHFEDGRLLRPSSRVDASALAPRRTASTRILRGVLRGDLDAILERALRREPELRYASASELAEDLERWLAEAPVLARAGNWRYRADKFVRRHWLALGLAMAAVLALSVTTAISWRQSVRADLAAQAAGLEAERARNSRDFVLEMLRDLRPGAALKTPTRLLDNAAALVHSRFADDVDSRIELLLVLGDLERAYGRLGQSKTLLEEASAMALARYGESSVQWLDAEANFAHSLFREGAYRRGSDRLSRALRAYDQAGGPVGSARIRALARLGQLQYHLGENASALNLQSEAYHLARQQLQPTDPLRLTVLELYGEVLALNGQLEAAKHILTENLAQVRVRYGNRDLAVASALETLSTREIELGNAKAAVPLLLEAKAIADELLEGPHVIAAYVENTLGVAYLRLGHADQAEQAFQRALAIFNQLYQSPHRMLRATYSNLAEAAFERQHFEQAAEAFEAAAKQQDGLNANGPPLAIGPRCLAGEARLRAGALADALQLLENCVAELRTRQPEDAYFLAASLGSLAEALWRSGDRERARRSAEEALAFGRFEAVHDALAPLLVLIESGLQAGAEVAAYGEAALAATEHADLTRPCETRRRLLHLADRLATRANSSLPARLRERASRVQCDA